jgi:hypothetical protein
MNRKRGPSLRPPFPVSNAKKITIIGSIILVFIVTDMMFSFAGTTVGVSANWEIALFVIIACIFGVSQYLILNFIKRITTQIRKTVPIVKILNEFTNFYQYVALAFVITIIAQIFLFSYYNTAILNLATAINYTISGGIWGVLAIRLLAWYRSTRSFVVLSYSISSMSACIAFLLWVPYNAGVLLEMPTERDIQTPPTPYQFYELNTTMGILQYDSAIFIFVTVALLWISSILMLRQYSKGLGTIKFWIIVTVPLAFFMILPTGLIFAYIPSLLGVSSSDIPLYVTVIYTVIPGVLGGFIFAAPFFLIARQIPSTNVLKEYLIITGWGFIIFNVTTSGNVLNAAYPPFGISNVMLEVTACYLIFVGLYCAAISVSGDTNLRRMIRKSLLDQSRLLDSVGSAEMEQQTLSKISKIVREQQQTLVENTGVQSSVDEAEMKRYLEEVIQEVHNQRKD